MPSDDPRTGESFPAFGVANDEKKQYKNLDTGGNVIKNTLWLIKANSEVNFIGYTNLLTQMGSGKLHFLLEEREAKADYLDSVIGKKASIEERNMRLRPYVLTSILKAELMNLTRAEGATSQFRLEPINRSVGHDKVSALMYGMYLIKEIEEKERHKKRGAMAQFMFIN